MPKAAQFLPDQASLASEEGVDLSVYQCAGCGLVQLKNDPVPYYKEVIRATAFSEEMRGFRLKQFSHFIQKYHLQDKRVIEIGCGKGEYLSLIKQCGADAHGLEYSADSVSACIQLNLNVLPGFVDDEQKTLGHAPFEAFFMLSFLEHLPDPNSTLRGIGHNLTEDAVGIVEVPNFDMILKNKLFAEFIPDHLLYFTQDTLITALNINGFEILECEAIWHDYIISAVIRKRKPVDVSDFCQSKMRLKKQFDLHFDRFKNKKVAIWGAGHQALAVISLMELGDKVQYVVDSAPFKQGKYTPATHVPIVSPDKLVSEPVDVVIVMVASYTDEVVRVLRERYKHLTHLVVLRDFGLEIIY